MTNAIRRGSSAGFGILLLLILLLLPGVSLPAAAEDYPTIGPLSYTISDGEAMIVRCDTSVKGLVEIPDTIENCPVTVIAGSAFAYCSDLTGVTIPETVMAIGGNIFRETTLSENVDRENGALYIDNTLISVFTLTEGEFVVKPGTRVIAAGAFAECKRLTNVVLPEDLKDLNGIFYNCTGLTSIHIPETVTSIGPLTFSGCTALTEIDIPEGVTSIGFDAFSKCSSLKKITIGGNVKKMEDSIFTGCTSLTTAIFEEGVTTIPENCFFRCSALNQISLPGTLTQIGKNAFYGTAYYDNQANWSQDVLYIDEYLIEAKPTISGDYIVKDGTRLLADWSFGSDAGERTALRSVTIPPSVQYLGIGAFSFHTGLVSVDIQGDIQRIERWSFLTCSKLTTIRLPGSVAYVGERAFEDTALADVYYSGTQGSWDAMEVIMGNENLQKAKLHFVTPTVTTTTTSKTVTTTTTIAATTASTAAVTTLATVGTTTGTGESTTTATTVPDVTVDDQPTGDKGGTSLWWLLGGAGILLLAGVGALLIWRYVRAPKQ